MKNHSKHGILPPKGLLLSLLFQMPLLALSLPLRPQLPAICLGAALLIAGVALNLSADRQFRVANVEVCPFGETPKLLEEGPFRLTRNPMYLGFVLISAGSACMTGLWLNLLAAAGLLAWLQIRYVLPEEVFLHRELGEVYSHYKLNHPRWIGWVGRSQRQKSDVL